MKKKCYTMLLFIVLVLSLCACGETNETNKTNITEAETILTTEAKQETSEPTAETLNDVSTSQSSEETPKTNAIPIQCGDSIDNDNFLMTFDSVELLSEYSYDTSEYSSYSVYVENGYKLVIVKGHFENKSTTTISGSSFALSAVVNNTYVVDGFDVQIQFLRDNSFEIDAYTDLDYILYIQVPEKLANMFETVTFTLGFNKDLSSPSYIQNNDGTLTTETDNLYEFTSGLSSNIQETEETTTAQETQEATLSPSDLDEILSQQPCYVESTEYIVQDEQYKALYPDVLSVIIKNNSGTDLKSAMLAFVAWDKNNLPIKIKAQDGPRDGSYVCLCEYEDMNLINGETCGEDSGMYLREETADIETFKAIVVSYNDFDGNTWENPYYQNWLDIYENQRLSQ